MESPSLHLEDAPRYVMRPAHRSSALSMSRKHGGYSIVCTEAAQVSISSVQNASAMPPSWLRESRAVRLRACTHSAVFPLKR